MRAQIKLPSVWIANPEPFIGSWFYIAPDIGSRRYLLSIENNREKCESFTYNLRKYFVEMALSIPPPPLFMAVRNRVKLLNTFLPVQQKRRTAKLNLYIDGLQFSLIWIVCQNYLIDYIIGRRKFSHSADSNDRTH